ncbi:coronin, actin binding protein 2A, isoform CRA_a [Mus musculus]|nr:coronin, actin binding protein 2A, isoform CRA_a [Mus musculus]
MSWHPQYRSSKFRHVYGKPASKENCYDSVPITRSVHDNHFCAVNPHFIAVVTECAGGGAFLVIPLHQTGKLDPHYPKVCGHRGNVLDIKWNPFNDFEIASCSEDATIKIWNIPKQLLTRNLTTYRKELIGHARRVGLVEWHPTTANILFSAGYDYKVMVWNLDTKDSVIAGPVKTINCHQDVILSMSFNTNGSLLATTCKDRKIRIVDPRLGIVLQEASYKGHRANKVLFLGSLKKLLSTGTSRWNNRQMALWDQENLSVPLTEEDLDGSSGVLFPFFDSDTSMLYIVGKGDGNIRYYEVSMEKPHLTYLTEYRSYNPQKGIGPIMMSLRPGSELLDSQTLPPERPLSNSMVQVSPQPLEPMKQPAEDGDQAPFSLLEEKLAKWTAEHHLGEKSCLTNGFDVFECSPPKTENELLQMFYRQQEEIRRLRELLIQREVQTKQLELEIKNLRMALGQL